MKHKEREQEGKEEPTAGAAWEMHKHHYAVVSREALLAFLSKASETTKAAARQILRIRLALAKENMNTINSEERFDAETAAFDEDSRALATSFEREYMGESDQARREELLAGIGKDEPGQAKVKSTAQKIKSAMKGQNRAVYGMIGTSSVNRSIFYQNESLESAFFIDREVSAKSRKKIPLDIEIQNEAGKLVYFDAAVSDTIDSLLLQGCRYITPRLIWGTMTNTKNMGGGVSEKQLKHIVDAIERLNNTWVYLKLRQSVRRMDKKVLGQKVRALDMVWYVLDDNDDNTKWAIAPRSYPAVSYYNREEAKEYIRFPAKANSAGALNGARQTELLVMVRRYIMEQLKGIAAAEKHLRAGETTTRNNVVLLASMIGAIGLEDPETKRLTKQERYKLRRKYRDTVESVLNDFKHINWEDGDNEGGNKGALIKAWEPREVKDHPENMGWKIYPNLTIAETEKMKASLQKRGS